MSIYAGFDLGGTLLKYGLIDEGIRILFQNSVGTPHSSEELVELIHRLWVDLKTRAPGRIISTGFGFPGLFSHSEQKILQSPNCPAIENLPLVRELGRFLDVPFYIDNEANLAAYGEYQAGAGRGAHSLVLLTIGTGIGTGIILNGRIWHGACGFAGELGHAPVNPDGEPCRCGSSGCLETEVSAARIVQNYQAGERQPEPLTAREVHSRAEQGDAAAAEAFRRAGRFLGMGIATVINLLNPARVILGGGVMDADELLLLPAISEARRRSYHGAFECCTIRKAELENDAGFIGAAVFARDENPEEKESAGPHSGTGGNFNTV